MEKILDFEKSHGYKSDSLLPGCVILDKSLPWALIPSPL